MLGQLFLIFLSTKLVLSADDEYHSIPGCASYTQDCPKEDLIKFVAQPSNKYCHCTSRGYQINFDVKTMFQIPDQFFVNSRISTITIPNTCTSIGEGAFAGSTIGTLTFAGSNIGISKDAFSDVTFTGSLTLPSELTTINSYVFYYTTFNTLTLPDKLKTIQSYAFHRATFNEDVTLRSNLGTVSSKAFYFATFGKSVKFENAKTSIMDNSFMNSTIRGTLTLPSELKSIASSTFESASFYSNLVIPNDVNTISGSAFAYAFFARDITFSRKLETISSNAFQATIFSMAVTFQNSTTKISNSAFISAQFYQTLVLPTEISTTLDYGSKKSLAIGKLAFKEAIFHHSITFPTKLEFILAHAFEGAQFTDSISFPASLKQIDDNAFKSCVFNSETILTFGRSFEKIGDYVFQNSNLQSISFDQQAKLDSIGQQAFKDLFQLKVVGESKSLYSETISVSAFENDENIDFSSITSKNINNYAFRNCFNLVVKDGIVILADGSVSDSVFLNCKKLNGPLTMFPSIYSDPTSTIGSKAFMDTGLTYLNLPHIASIGQDAFRNCVLLQGPINETYEELYVDTISSDAFNGDILLHYTTIKSENIQTKAFYLCRNLGSNIVLLGKEVKNERSNDNIKLGNVGSYSFYSCEKLGNLTFDLSLLNDYQFINSGIVIPEYAFAKSGLTGPLVIPHTISTISQFAFSNCPNIKDLQIIRQQTVFLTISNDAFANSNIGTNLVIPRFVTEIGTKSFANTSIETLTIEGTSFTNNAGENPTEIKSDAFKDCIKLKTLVLGNESIKFEEDNDKNPFRGCHIESLQIGNVNKIPNDAFVGMSKIDTAIFINDSVTYIGDRAFSECSSIPSVTISPNSNLKTIGKAAFYKCKNIESIVIPPGVTKIDEYAFYKCEKLNKITILSHDTGSGITIEKYAFYGCSNLKGTLTLPEGLSKIGEGAFQLCNNLVASLDFPYSLTEIEERAFMGCSSLTGGLKFDVNFKKIGKYAFRDCSSLNGELNIVDYYGEKAYRVYVHEGAFCGCSNLIGDLNIPIRCYLMKVLSTNSDGDILTYELSSNVFKGCSKLNGQLNLPETITEIPAGTFCDCSSLNGQIKNDLEYIGNQAFKNCVKFTGSVDLSNYDFKNRKIGSYAFYNCTGLNGQIIFKELNNEVFITIGEYAFYNCNGLTGTLNCTSLQTIGHHAFTGCRGLNGSLYFGLYLLKVGAYAFADCTGFSGTLSLRSIINNELSIEESAFKGCTGFKDGTLLIYMDRSNIEFNEKPSSSYYLKIERDAFNDTKFKDIRYIGRQQPDCDCDIGLPSRKGIHTSSNYDGKSFCGNPLHKSKLNGGAIAGIVIACIVVVAVIIFLVVFFLLKNKKNRDNSENEVEMNHDP